MAYIGNFPASTQTVDFKWQSVQTSAFSAVTGKGYFVNTTSCAITVTLPSSANIGDAIAIVDYAGTFATNNITLTSSLNIEGATDDKVLTTNREGVTITYVDTTQGWVATSGVNSGDQAIDPITYSADFLVIAGGGSGRGARGGAGGAGGFRTSTQTVNGGTVITVTVGDGGASVTGYNLGNSGSDSSISGSGLTTITSAGGGYGGNSGGGGNGGSGGGSTDNASGGSGNTPSTSPSQGNNGGVGANGGSYGGGGGGGASAVGSNGTTSAGGAGGNGSSSSITGSSVTYSGGGGGGYYQSGSAGAGGSGGGGAGATSSVAGTSGTVNTGGGGGGGHEQDSNTFQASGAGGKGVVILSMPDANYSGTTTGSPLAGIVEMMAQTMDSGSFGVTLEEEATVADLKSEI